MSLYVQHEVTHRTLLKAVSKQLGYPFAACQEVVNAYLGQAVHSLEAGSAVRMHRLGKFHLVRIDAHEVHDLTTGLRVMRPAATRLTFKGESGLRVRLKPVEPVLVSAPGQQTEEA